MLDTRCRKLAQWAGIYVQHRPARGNDKLSVDCGNNVKLLVDLGDDKWVDVIARIDGRLVDRARASSQYYLPLIRLTAA